MPGRRFEFSGNIGRGPAEAWTHPFRLLHALSIEGRTVASGAALELPLAIWEIEGAGSPARMAWSVELPVTGVSADGRSALCAGSNAPVRAYFGVEGGMISAADVGGVARISCEGDRLKVVAIGATDEADLDRTLDLLARRGVAGLARQREQHADQVTRGGASLRTPDEPRYAETFEAAKHEADAMLGEWPGWGRTLLDRGADGPGRAVTGIACETAHGLLAAGMRDAARDTLKFLARLQDASGDVPVECGFDGSLRYAKGEGAKLMRWLAARYRDWTGEAVEAVEAVGVVGEVNAGGREPAVVGVLLAGIGLWGVVPDAPGGVVQLRPALPPGWTRMSFSRLRVGRTVLDLHYRRRRGTTQITVRRGSGPPIVVDCDVSDPAPAATELDGIAMGSSRLRFEASGDHEILLHAGD